MHRACVTADMLLVMETLFSDQYIRSIFALGGGTALALQLGHRKSVDIDLIAEKYFEAEKIERHLRETFADSGNTNRSEFGLFAKVKNIKTDFLSWNIPFMRGRVEIGGIPMLHLEEIAAMKLFAILQRGEKKDYWDVATLLQHYSLPQLVSFFRERHPNHDENLVLKYLCSYADIEFQPDPVTMNGKKWNEMKTILETAVSNYPL